ncbi:MAG: O-antigen ligase family protein [Oscillospiraceae bacterium]|nr:O-antigen ligase family protein [Oscillospiraceae bacterium]
MPKTILGTSEKSNFILNMKTGEYYKYNLRILQLFLVLMPVLSVPLEFAKVYSVPGMALSVTGVLAIVFMFIGFMKKVTPKTLWLPAILFGGMIAWGGVSVYNCYFRNIGLLGADGRSEGLLSIVFYACFFMLGAQLGTDDNRKKLLYSMLWMGLAECVWALLQMLPLGFPSYYKNLEPLLVFRTFLPSGLTGSPIFLATLLVMLLFPAMLGAVFAEENKAQILCLVSAAVFALTAVRTQCLIGLAGTGLAVAAGVVTLLLRKGGKRALLTGGIVLAAFAVGFAWSWFAPAVNGTYDRAGGENVAVENGYVFYDGAIMWEDSAYRLNVSGYYMPNGTKNPYGHFDAESIPETYGFIWRVAGDIAKKYPLAGSGPDNLVYPQMFQSLVISGNPNTFDRAYDFYLHTAASMGFPMLALLIAVLVITVKRGAGQVKGSWIGTAVFGAAALYLAVMVIGSSCITVAPLFWMLAGCCCHGKEETA